MKEKTNKTFTIKLMVFNNFCDENYKLVKILFEKDKETNVIKEKRLFIKQGSEILDIVINERKRFETIEVKNLKKMEKWLNYQKKL